MPNFDIALPDTDVGTGHGYPKHLGIRIDMIDPPIRQYCDTATVYRTPELLEGFDNPDQVMAYAKWLKTLLEPDYAGWLVWRLVSHQDDGKLPDRLQAKSAIRRS